MKRFRPANLVHARLFDGEMVVLHLDRGEYYALNEIGTELWSGLESGKTLAEIADSVVARFDVARDRALADLTELCNELLARGLVDECG